MPDQIFDMTKGLVNTFFEVGLVAHIGTADPYCPDLSAHLYQALMSGGANVHSHGAFLICEGPRFSTRAESNTYRSWGMSIIGMTAAPEAFLVREAEMCYTSIAHITDYDVWHTTEEAVSVEMVLKIIAKNTAFAQDAIAVLAENPPPIERSCGCLSALDGAIITNSDVIPKKTRKKLNLLVSKYLED